MDRLGEDGGLSVGPAHHRPFVQRYHPVLDCSQLERHQVHHHVARPEALGQPPPPLQVRPDRVPPRLQRHIQRGLGRGIHHSSHRQPRPPLEGAHRRFDSHSVRARSLIEIPQGHQPRSHGLETRILTVHLQVRAGPDRWGLCHPLEGQRDVLRAAGCAPERIYTDVASGAHTARPGLDLALAALREGDVLVVQRLDRVGRSLAHLVEVVDGLRARGVGFRVLSGDIDTTSPQGRLIFHIFCAMAEFEREVIRERTMVGLAAARARGRKGGRPPKMTAAKVRHAMRLMSDRSAVGRQVAAELGVSSATLYRYVDGQGRPKTAARKLLGTEPPVDKP